MWTDTETFKQWSIILILHLSVFVYEPKSWISKKCSHWMTGTHQLFGIPDMLVLVYNIYNICFYLFIVVFSQHCFISHTIISLHCCKKVSFKQIWKNLNLTFYHSNYHSTATQTVWQLHCNEEFCQMSSFHQCILPGMQNSYTIRG